MKHSFTKPEDDIVKGVVFKNNFAYIYIGKYIYFAYIYIYYIYNECHFTILPLF